MSELTEGHTVKRYDGELAQLRISILEMGGLVSDQVKRAVKALRSGNIEAAREVIARDRVVNDYDVRINDEVIQLLAKRQPLATDLRVITSIAKATTDLERIGDEAKKVARIGLKVHESGEKPPAKRLYRRAKVMADLVSSMLRGSLTALDTLDVDAARKSAELDSELDDVFEAGLRHLATFVMEDTRNIGHAIEVVLVTKALERIGDHLTNLSEYVVYIVEGADVRHVTSSRSGFSRDRA